VSRRGKQSLDCDVVLPAPGAVELETARPTWYPGSMRFPQPLLEGVLVRRYKRFLADIRLEDGREITAHCPNSGSMKTVAIPGNRALVSPADNPKRKLKWTWEVAYVGDGSVPALVNTALPNRVVREGIELGLIPELAQYDAIRPEVPYGERSRIDLLLTGAGRPDTYVEVKNVTLLNDDEPGMARFPDAVTTRGTRHLRELMGVVAAGGRGVLVFHTARGDAEQVRPADTIDPTYGETLREAHAAGVEILAYRVRVTPEEVTIERPLPVVLVDG
jgi:sugar fermentation stimulation protein A